MDDLICTGVLSITGLYAAVVLLVVSVIITFMELYRAAVTGDSTRIAVILGVLLLIIAVYTGIGIWLQKSGRI